VLRGQCRAAQQMAIKRKAVAQGPKAKRPKTTDDTLTALKKLLPGRSAAALSQVAVWFKKEIDVETFADLESADTWAKEVQTLLELDDTLSLGSRGLIKELLKVLTALGPRPDDDEDEEVVEAAEEEEEAAEEEEEEEEAPKKKAVAKPKGKVKVAAVETAAEMNGSVQRAFLDPPAKPSKAEQQQIDSTREEMEVTVTTPAGKPIAPVTTFEELDVLPDYVMEALKEQNITAPLPIQSQALPIALRGHDVTGIAKTGSGKTLAFLLPAIVHIEAQPAVPKGRVPTPICLIVAPTRELVVQIHEEAQKLVKDSKDGGSGNHPGGLWSAVIYGGKSKDEQLRLCRLGTHILAATPGRLADNIRNNEISLKRCTFFVLDEADRMLEEGFSSEIKFFSKNIRKERHMLFFSATWPAEVERLSSELCVGKKTPVHLGVGQREDGAGSARETILQEVVCFRQGNWEERDAAKKELLFTHCREVLQEEDNKILVFVSSKTLADELRDTLWKEGFKTDSMHGGRTQDTRLNVLAAFRSGETRMVVATDVMGRGLDIPDISHVVIYDMGETDDYVHRIGRTARGPSGQGHALTFFEFDPKWPEIAEGLVQVLEQSGQEVPDDLREIAESAVGMEGVMAKRRNKAAQSVDWEQDDDVDDVFKSKSAGKGKSAATSKRDYWEEDEGGGGGWGGGQMDLLAMVAQAAFAMGSGGGGW